MKAIRAGQIKQISAVTQEAVFFEDHSQRCGETLVKGHSLNRKLATSCATWGRRRIAQGRWYAGLVGTGGG